MGTLTNSLNDVVSIELTIGTLAVLISGLYISNAGISIEAIPSSMFIEIAETLSEHLPLKDILLENWIKDYLIVAPRELFSEEELEEYKSNKIFIERKLGNVTLIATGKMP